MPSFKKSGELESMLKNFIQQSNGKINAQYHDNILEAIIYLPNMPDSAGIAKNLASFLEENKIVIEGASSSFVNGRLLKEQEKRGGLLW